MAKIRKRISNIVTTFVVLSILSACSLIEQKKITGSPMIYSIDKGGYIRDRDIYLTGTYISEPDVITISINTIFLKYIKDEFELRGNQLLVYSEVFDSPEEVTPQRTVIFNQKHQPDNAYIATTDKAIYGPVKFKGHPIQIKLYIVELDKQDNEFKKELLQILGNVVEASKPELTPIVGSGISIGKLFAAFNDDDFELRIDLTLYPTKPGKLKGLAPLDSAALGVPDSDIRAQLRARGHHLNMPLRSGNYLISKRETGDRDGAEPVSSLRERLSDSCFMYTQNDTTTSNTESETLGTDEVDVPSGVYVLQYKGGYLWLSWLRPLTEVEKDPDNKDKYCHVEVKGDKAKNERNVQYIEKTYVIFNVSNGGRASDAQKVKEVANKNFDKVKNLLQSTNENEALKAARELTQNTASMVAFQNLIDSVNERVRRDPEFRNRIDFPMALIARLIHTKDSANKLYIYKYNRLLLRNIEAIFLNFPLFSELDNNDLTKIKDLKEKVSDMTKAKNHIIADVKGNGVFNWKD